MRRALAFLVVAFYAAGVALSMLPAAALEVWRKLGGRARW